MNTEDPTELEDAVQQCPVITWRGTVWRFHKRQYSALDSTGSSRFTGRFHRAVSQYSPHESWRALYLALAPETCIGEILRNTPPEFMSDLNSYRLSEAEIELASVVDCRVLGGFGIPVDDLIRDIDYALTQRIAKAAISTGAEAILVPSATLLGDNLVIFPDYLRPESRLTVIGSRDPKLYVERS